MDSLIAASARALAAGDALGALKHVALRDDPPALALRGIAMAQLGELATARDLLRRAARRFGAHEAVSRARCVVAEAEVALAMRDFAGSPRTLTAAAAILTAQADRANAVHARLIATRRLLLLGRLDEAAIELAGIDLRERMPASLAAVAELSAAELALRSLRTGPARTALRRAHAAARVAGVPALMAEVTEAQSALDRPAARRHDLNGTDYLMRLDEVEALLGSETLVVDACRRGVSAGARWRPLTRRPVLFALILSLAQAWPGDLDREALIAQVFRSQHPDETHRARLRVEISRLRALLNSLVRIDATARGFVLVPHRNMPVAVLMPPIAGEQAALLALLSDGAAWSTSALAQALGTSQRTVQRDLAELQAADRVRSLGQARARRWLAPALTGFTTALLLPVAMRFA